MTPLAASLYLLGGFALALLQGSLLAGAAFIIVLVVYALFFAALFLRRNLSALHLALFGFTLGIELLGNAPPGAAFLTAALILAAAHLIPILLRFTTPYAQGIVGVLVSTMLTTLLLGSGFLALIPLILSAWIVSSLGFFLLTRRYRDPFYEHP